MSRVALLLYADADAFAADAEDFLAEHALRATVIASTLAAIRNGTVSPVTLAPMPYWFATQRDSSGKVTGIAMRTSDFPPYLLDLDPEGAARLADRVRAAGEQPAGANGTPKAAWAFCERLAVGRPAAIECTTATRLFRLDALLAPIGVPGRGRPAHAGEIDLLAQWVGAFHDEAVRTAGPPPAERLDADRAVVADKLAQGGQWVWEDEGRVVASAAARPPSFGYARIGPVYTPPADRRRGYAAGVTAVAAQAILDQGATPCLFTDLANSTSNGVYRRLGFRAVDDTVELTVTPGH